MFLFAFFLMGCKDDYSETKRKATLFLNEKLPRNEMVEFAHFVLSKAVIVNEAAVISLAVNVGCVNV